MLCLLTHNPFNCHCVFLKGFFCLLCPVELETPVGTGRAFTSSTVPTVEAMKPAAGPSASGHIMVSSTTLTLVVIVSVTVVGTLIIGVTVWLCIVSFIFTHFFFSYKRVQM